MPGKVFISRIPLISIRFARSFQKIAVRSEITIHDHYK